MLFPKIFKVIFFLVCSFFLLESCSEKEAIQVDEIKEQAEPDSPLKELLSSEIFWNTDRKFCFDLVYPIELILFDETTKSINSYEKLLSFMANWYENNRENLKSEPIISYPIKATLKDEMSSELNDDMAFLAMIENCLDAVYHEFFFMLGSECYHIEYPITIIEKDDTKVKFDSYEELFESLFRNERRPVKIEFPFNITIGTKQVIVNSEKDLEQSIDDCFLVISTQPQNNTFYCGFIDNEILRWVQYDENYEFLEACFNINYPVTIISDRSGELKISNNEEFITEFESILNMHSGNREESIDFNYPVEVTLVEEDRIVAINSGEEFIKLFEHCW